MRLKGKAIKLRRDDLLVWRYFDGFTQRLLSVELEVHGDGTASYRASALQGVDWEGSIELSEDQQLVALEFLDVVRPVNAPSIDGLHRSLVEYWLDGVLCQSHLALGGPLDRQTSEVLPMAILLLELKQRIERLQPA